MQDAHDLGVIIDSRIPLVVMETHDENRALDLLQRVARERDIPLYRWTVTDGLDAARFGLQVEKEARLSRPEEVLRHLKERPRAGLYMLCDFHPWIADYPENIRLLKDIALRNDNGALTLVFVSQRLRLPPELVRFAASFAIPLPSRKEILDLVREEARLWASRNDGVRVKADPEALKALANNLRGLGRGEVRRLARRAIVDDGAITHSDLPAINRAKFRLMDMDGVLHYEHDTAAFAEVAGMANLRQWLERRRDAFIGDGPGDTGDIPRGALLLGVQGGGKSLAARAVAGLWQLPLLRLDTGALYNKYHGETERNLRDALALADRMAPCVLWLDEIEKGLAPGDGDSGLSRRVLGALLTWMAERRSRVFMVATANDISRLPPELVRKGRFDEIFFVDLPDFDTRQQIFAIHLARRSLPPEGFDLDALAEAAVGFSGAEIEQVVVASFYAGRSREESPDTGTVLEEIAATTPLSRVMAEKLGSLRNWARERGIAAV
jgi:SpoVK/Ycf46/Vps4 family AAA+-type ATPase